MVHVSKRLQQIPASGTIAISNLVSEMKAHGVDIVSFSMGEPDFVTPENIIGAAKKSLDEGFTHYTPSMGVPDLREAIANAVRKDNGINASSYNVLVTPTKQAIFLTALAYLDPGDEVILPDPGWVSYEADIKLCGAKPVYVPLFYDEDFILSPERVEAAITPKTRMIVLNTPANPTGCVLPEATIRAIAEIAEKHDLMVLADEIYEKVIYSGRHFSIASIPGMMDRTITVSGLSKTYAMTGWRVGWAVSSVENIKSINKLQTHSISCCTSFAQMGAVEALNGPTDSRDRMVAEFKKRRDLALDLLAEVKGIECKKPEGAFYLFPKYDADIHSADLATKLLKEAHVAVTPGAAFGPHGEGFFRISYATSDDQIREGISRIKKFMQDL
ncbi:Aspartate/tyrosine/aromatic aminotransferase [Thermoplasmatales archaeon BRNA1]|nr:Aspartate/tyrosine/aromatic aminotransferase [Thermoplasmatales archaeon BRNA1]